MESNAHARGSHDHFRSNDLVALYFKVPHDFRCWLKTEAAIRNVTMTELLMTALLRYVEAESMQRPVHNPYACRLSGDPESRPAID